MHVTFDLTVWLYKNRMTNIENININNVKKLTNVEKLAIHGMQKLTNIENRTLSKFKNLIEIESMLHKRIKKKSPKDEFQQAVLFRLRNCIKKVYRNLDFILIWLVEII